MSSTRAKTPYDSPVTASQTRAVRSSDAVATRWPSGEYSAPSSFSAWPSSVRSFVPSAASHIIAVASADVVTTRDPSGPNMQLSTAPPWP